MKILTNIFAAIGLVHLLIDLALFYLVWKWAKDFDREEQDRRDYEECKKKEFA